MIDVKRKRKEHPKMDIKIAGINFHLSFDGICKHVTVNDRVTFHGLHSGYDAGQWIANDVHGSSEFERFLNTVDDDGKVSIQITTESEIDSKIYEELVRGYSRRYDQIINGV